MHDQEPTDPAHEWMNESTNNDVNNDNNPHEPYLL